MVKWIYDNIVLILYGITLLAMNIFMVNSSQIINYIRYIYTLFITLFVVVKYRNDFKLNKFIALICAILLVHTLLFGFILAKGNIQSGVIDNGKEMIIFIFFIFFTSYYIKAEKKFKEFLIVSSVVFTLFTNINYLLHFNGWAPIKFLPAMFGIGDLSRVRFSFGYVSYNTAAYGTLPSFILAVLMIKNYVKVGGNHSKATLLCLAYYIFSVLCSSFVILSTQTRIAFLVAVLFLLLIFVLNNKKIVRIICTINWKIYIILFLGILVLYGYYIFNTGNSRSNYIPVNIAIYNQYATKWFGLGYLMFTGFLTDAYGVNTAAMDNYYLYILCSTGIVGIILVGYAILFLLIKFLKIFSYKSATDLQRSIAVIFIAMLFVAFTESNWIAPFKPETYIYWLLYFCAIYESDSIKRQRNSKVSFLHGFASTRSKELV